MVALDGLAAWFEARIPAGWYCGPLDVRADRDEILVIGTVRAPRLPKGATPEARRAALARQIALHREVTREHRIRIAQEAEHAFGRKVTWGARCGEREEVFTSLTVPVMTRLRMNERQVLDTLIDAGIARSRSEALAWCVRLVGKHQGDWILQLRAAMEAVERVRALGPDVD